MRNACARTCMRTESALPDITCKRVRNQCATIRVPAQTHPNRTYFCLWENGRRGGADTLLQARLSDHKRRMPILAKRRLATLANLGRSFRTPVPSCNRCRRRSSLSALYTHIDADRNVNADTDVDADTGTSARKIHVFSQNAHVQFACVRVCSAHRRKQIHYEHGAHRYGSGAGGPG